MAQSDTNTLYKISKSEIYQNFGGLKPTLALLLRRLCDMQTTNLDASFCVSSCVARDFWWGGAKDQNFPVKWRS